MLKDSVPTAAQYQDEPVRYPALTLIDLSNEASAIKEQYKNIVLSQVNSSCLRMSVIEGEYPWHYHPHSDELFLVVEGSLSIELADGRVFKLGPRQSITIPANTVHRTSAATRTVNLCFEQVAAGTVFVDGPPAALRE
jgi:mannose-6-phosphate isomerase-like protein (cupin superfamily)